MTVIREVLYCIVSRYLYSASQCVIQTDCIGNSSDLRAGLSDKSNLVQITAIIEINI